MHRGRGLLGWAAPRAAWATLLAVLGGPAMASGFDPWGRPKDLRLVPAAPEAWGELGSPAPQRLWWSAGSAAGGWTVAVHRRGRWQVLTEAASPGFITPPLAPGTGVRVRGPDATRWSELVYVSAVVDAESLAILAGPEGTVRARTVGQVVVAEDTGVVHASTLGGGVVRVGEGDTVEVIGRWQGLPSPWAIAVDAREDELLVGTDLGAWWRGPDSQEALDPSCLPSSHVQAVLLHEVGMFLGTDAGLVRWSGGSVDTLLRPWAVYSLAPDPGGDLLVGYEGWLRLPASAPALGEVSADRRLDPGMHDLAEEVLGQQPGLDFYELAERDGVIHGAAWQRGPLILDVEGAPRGSLAVDRALGLTWDTEGRLWVAAGEAGLHAEGALTASWPWQGNAGVVWDVAAAPDGRIWVATDRGLGVLGPEGDLGWPATLLGVGEWPADLPVWDGVIDDHGAWLGGPEGLRRVGGAVPGQGDLLAGWTGPVGALEEDGRGGLWVVGPGEVAHLHRRGAWDRLDLDSDALSAEALEDGLLVSTSAGVVEVAAGPLRVVGSALPPQSSPASSLASAHQVTWVVQGGRLVRHEGGEARGVPLEHRAVAVDADGSARVCVGTSGGLELLGPHEELQAVALGRRVGVTAVALTPEGRCWYATEDGEIGLAGEGSLAWSGQLELRGAPPRALVLDGSGGVWVFSEGGSARVSPP